MSENLNIKYIIQSYNDKISSLMNEIVLKDALISQLNEKLLSSDASNEIKPSGLKGE